MELEHLHKGIRDTLRTALTPREFELGKAPSEKPNMPYGIIYPIPSTVHGGFDGDEDVEQAYHIASVGVGVEQVGDLQSRIFNVMTAKTGSEYIVPMDFHSTYKVQWRILRMLGAPEPEGSFLFRSNDLYVVRWGRTQP